MGGLEFALVVIVVGCVTGIIKTWLTRGKDGETIDRETFDRLAQAFVQHKREMQERIQNLETIIANETDREEELHYSELEDTNNKESSLTNDLKQKKRSR